MRLLFRLPARGGLYIKMGLAVFGLLAVVALFLDLGRLQRRMGRRAGEGDLADLQAIVLGSTGEPYRDPDGVFSIVKPAGWKVQPLEEGAPAQVVFTGSDGMDLRVTLSEPTDKGYDALLDRLRGIEEDLEARTHIEEIDLGGRRAFQRTCRLFNREVLMVDLIENGRWHHIQFSAPAGRFERYRPVMLDIIGTYRSPP